MSVQGDSDDDWEIYAPVAPADGWRGAPPAALALPEILREVLAHLTRKPAALFAAALVNRFWSGPALDLLWRHPTEDAFAYIWSAAASADIGGNHTNDGGATASLRLARRQFYAEKVRGVVVEDDLAVLQGLAFPRLRSVQLPWLSVFVPPQQHAHHGAVLSQLLVPQLERLTAHLDPAIAALLQAHRPRLRALEVRGVEGDRHFADEREREIFLDRVRWSEDLLAERMPLVQLRSFFFGYVREACAHSLRSLTLCNVGQQLMRELIVGLLAPHETLAEVTTQSHTWGMADLEQLLVARRQTPLPPSAPPPFRALRCFDGTIAATAVPILMRVLNPSAMRSLTLDIMLNEQCRQVFPFDPPYYEHSGPVFDDEADAGAASQHAAQWNAAASAAIEAIAAHLPHLRSLWLIFFVDTMLSHRSVMALRALSELEELTLTDQSSGAEEGEVVRAELHTGDLGALFGPLARLRRLQLDVSNDLSPRWMLPVGQACPLLYELNLPWNTCDIMSLAEAGGAQTPLFPHLRKLQVDSFDPLPAVPEENRPQNDEKQFAKQQAPLLILHAPRLSKVMAIKGSNAFNRALRRTYTMLAAPRKVLWELPQGEYNASSGALSD